jgi:UDP-N-acetylmuramate--alanine ligase
MNYKRVHCLGVGGIGLSALARYYKENGAIVTGEDDSHGETTDLLQEEGVEVSFPISGANITSDVDVLVYTVALPKTHPAIQKALELGVKIMTYPEALGEMTNHKRMIAVCGTHGKTTTTAMAFYALRAAGVDASMIVGSLINHPQPLFSKEGSTRPTNYIHGNSEWIVVEACEYRRSFLNYNPEIILLTNIDNDHLDYFGNIEETKKAFQEFIDKLKLDGTLISHPEYLEMFKTKNKVATDFAAVEDSLELQVPGEHNRKNASLVVGLGEALKLDQKKVIEGLNQFPGTWRRQEYKGDLEGLKMFDDYGHHPTEVRVTIEAFKEKFVDKKIIVCFQPHLFSRTKLLFADFVSSLSLADEVLLLPIYAAREPYDETVSSLMLQESINQTSQNPKAKHFENIEQVVEYLKNLPDKENTIFLNLGAGDAYQMFDLL